MLTSENPSMELDLRILAESPPVPSNAFVIRKEVDLPCFDCHQRMAGGGSDEADIAVGLELGNTIKKYLLEMDRDPKGMEALTAVGNAQRFLETEDSDYSELYSMLEEIQFNPEDLLRRD